MCEKIFQNLSKSCIGLLLLLLSSVMVYGQSAGATTAIVTGRITDIQNSVIGGVNVSAKNLETNLIRETNTNDEGSYIITQLPPGNYELTFSHDGFTPRTLRFELVLGTTALFNAALSIDGSSDIIEVNAGSAIDESKTESSTNIARNRIDNLPINRRNFLDFTLTSPRATRDRAPAQGVVASSGLSFNGQQARFNNITVDGVDNNEVAAGSVRATFSQDAVQEFQVVSDSYSAEFGRAVGGIVNIITKGGGNDFHGSLFLLNRNDATSARDVFAPFEPEYKQYQFGATVGGPIKRDRLFFFNSFERTTINQSNFVAISDQSVRSARSQGFILSNGPLPFAFATTSALARLDARINSHNSLFVRYNYGGNYNGAFEPFGGLIGETAGGIQLLSENTLSLSNTYISSSLNFINETRFLYNKRKQDVNAPEGGPRVQIFAPEGLVTFGRTTFLPQPRQETNFQIIDNVTLIRDRHQLKFGVDFYSFKLPNDGKTRVPIFAGGFAVFQPLNFAALNGPIFSGAQAFDPALRTLQQQAFLVALAQALPMMASNFPSNVPLTDLALPTAYAQGFGNPNVEGDSKEFTLFVQDDIKLRPNLLVKLGLRYDINRAAFMPNNNGNFSPRVAVAYHPQSIEKLNLRAAYGIFYGVPLIGNATIVELTSIKETIKIPVIPFPFSVLPFALPGHKFPESQTIPAGVTFLPQLSTVFTYDKNLRANYTQQVTASIDYQLFKNSLLSLSYNYVRGVKLLSVRNINPVVRPIAGDPLGSQLTGRVFPDKGQIFEFSSAYDTYFNGVTISLTQKIANRVDLFAFYTFSKAIDNFIDIGTDIQESVDPLNIRNERGLSLQDVRNRFVLSGTMDLGFRNNPITRNLQLATIINFESGRPYNLLAGVDLNQNGDNPAGDRPLVNGGSIGRNAGISPNFTSIDLRLTRALKLKERLQLSIILEVFNLLNRVNISEVDRIYSPDGQGNFNLPRTEGGRFIAPRERFRNAFSPRQFQFGFRFTF